MNAVAVIARGSAEATLKTLNASAVVDVRRQDAKGTLAISENGTYNVATFAEVAVDIPIPSNYGLITWDGSTLTVS